MMNYNQYVPQQFPQGMAGRGMHPGMMMHRGMHPGMMVGRGMHPGMMGGGMPQGLVPHHFPPNPFAYANAGSSHADVSEHKDAREEDPWLVEFAKKHTSSAAFDWSPLAVKARLKEAEESAVQLKALVEEIKRSPPSTATKLGADAKSLQAKLEELLSVFKTDDPGFLKFKQRHLKSRKNKRWQQKRLEQLKLTRTEKKKQEELMLKIIDEWQSKLIREHHAQLKEESEKKQKLMLQKQKKRDEERARVLRDVLVLLDELRALRAQNLELEGRPIPKTVSLHELLKQFIKEHPLAPPEEQPPVTNAPSESEAPAKPEVISEEPQQPQPPPYNAEDAVREFYDQANSAMDKLIEIRRQWDMFLVAPGYGSGSRIPPTYIVAPPPSRRWKRFVVKTKPTEVEPSTRNGNSTDQSTDASMEDAPAASVS